jgi:lipase
MNMVFKGTTMPEILSQKIDDVELQYLHYSGDGPTVVLLHATGFQPWLWHPIARELAGNFSVVAPYFCDHRMFDPTDGGMSWLILAHDLVNLIEHLDITEPLIVGHSMGATVAAIAEVLNGLMASRMILIEPIFLPSNFYNLDIKVEQHPLASKSIRRRSTWRDETEARAYLRSRKLFMYWDEEMLDLYLEHGMTKADNGSLTLACHPNREAALFMGGMEKDPWPLLDNIFCPVLFIEGENSENRMVIDLGRAASIIPGADLRVIKGAGHLVPMEKPYELLTIILEFFGS